MHVENVRIMIFKIKCKYHDGGNRKQEMRNKKVKNMSDLSLKISAGFKSWTK